MNETIQSAKDGFLGAKRTLLHSLSTTPDDRLNWSPAPSARTPLHLVVHAAEAVASIQGAIDGIPFPFSTTAAADRHFREGEAAYTSRDEVVRLFEGDADAFLTWLDALDPQRVGSMVDMPFGGPVPMALAITFPAFQTHYHAAQLDYLQTTYGDRDWHFELPNIPGP